MPVEGWPAASRRAVVVDNELYRPWIDDSEPRITVVQTVPAKIADQPVRSEAVGGAREEGPACGPARGMRPGYWGT